MRVAGGMVALLLVACSGGGSAKKPCTTPDCTAGTGCKTGRDCSLDAGFTCVQGVCSQRCDAARGCPGGQTCADVKGKGQCFAGCVDGKCATGVACQTEWVTRKQVCAASPFPNACKSVENLSGCSAYNPQYFTTDCRDGFVCPSGSDCELSRFEGECACAIGLTTTRNDGQNCITPNGDQICLPPYYYCKPDNLPGTDCATEPMIGGGVCHCADGRALPFVCGETSSCEHRCSLGCDILKQDCPDPWAPKCSLAFNTAAITFLEVAVAPKIDRLSCSALLGSKKLGEVCQLVPLADAGTDFARDDCDKGLVCEGDQLPRGERRCRKLCTARADCASGEACFYLGTTFPPSGDCLPVGCTLGGTDCPSGRSCVPGWTVEEEAALYCKVDGPNPIGESCLDAGCVAGSACRQNAVCVATCTPQKLCADGGCQYQGFYPGAPGYCD